MDAVRRPVRVGTVDYLNARPLVHGIERGMGRDVVELSYGVPAVLAARMRSGDLDVGLLPIVELAAMPGLEIASGMSIATLGAARSVLLVCRREPASLASLALDPESRTSNVLARVILHRVWRAQPMVVESGVDLGKSLSVAEAAVRIGDKALFDPLPAGIRAYDLGEEWTRATGLPFVFAAWAARSGVIDAGLHRLLRESLREGMQSVDAIARAYTWNGRRHPDIARAYLARNIRYDLGPAEIRAMEVFFRAACEAGCLDSVPAIRLAPGHGGPRPTGRLAGDRARAPVPDRSGP